MQVHARSARDTLCLADQAAAAIAAPWAIFDADWYRLRYRDAPRLSAEELLEWYLTQGQIVGHSPNRYFDEAWQREAWPGILQLIEARSVASAFDAWCMGPHVTRPPHWLFDPREYRTRYPAMTDEVLAETGFVNHYHHYLRFGAAEGRIGHSLFNPAVYLQGLEAHEAKAAAEMPFRHYLQGLEIGAPERRTSLLFDPSWYRERYVDAVLAVGTGQYRSFLEHYLRNDHPTSFDPSPWFSEEHYLANNPRLAEALGGFRNGFDHFVAFGLAEGRSPHPALDLSWYARRGDVTADIEAGLAPDAFSHWIAIGQPAGLPGRPPPVIEVNEKQAVALYERRAMTVWPLYGRHKLDFTRRGAPAVSVIMAMRNQFAETMTSLASARAHFRDDIELILIDSDPVASAVDSETHVTGATILKFGTSLPDSAAREAGLICATADAVLLLADGVDLAPGAIRNALARLMSDPAIGAVGARLIQPHGTLLEAGGIVWRDGQIQRYLRDASPAASEANFVREVDFCSTLFLLARRDVLTSLPDPAAGIADSTHDAADLCARIRDAGFRVLYEPDAVAFLTKAVSTRHADGRAAFVAAHAKYLATRPVFDPAATIGARSCWRGETRVLFIEDSVPLRRIGSGFVRSNDILRSMVAAGASVTVFPMKQADFPLSTIRAELPDAVEVMHRLTAEDFAAFSAERTGCYDLIWIARTHNLDLVHEAVGAVDDASVPPRAFSDMLPPPNEPTDQAPSVSQIFDLDPLLLQEFNQFDPSGNVAMLTAFEDKPVARRQAGDSLAQRLSGHGMPRPTVVIDTEAVTSVRRAVQATLLDQPFDLDAALHQEFRNLDSTMHVVAVTEAEAEIIRTRHRGPVTVLGHTIAAAPTTRGFEERTGILFVGAIHEMDHPNYDGLTWFIEQVLPLIERALRWETRLTVAGYVGPGVTLDRFKGHARVTLRGAVADLVPLYDANRVFIAPARFAAGIPYKVHEAAAFGLPVVATNLLAGQLGWTDGEEIGAADGSDPASFAARVIALHRDADLWHRMREAALTRIRTQLDPADFSSHVARLLDTAGSRLPGPREVGADET